VSDNQASLGAEIRRTTEPVAQRIGVDYNKWFSSPPTSPEARAFGVLLCGDALVRAYAYPEAWPVRRPGDARRAAQTVRLALRGDRGRGAASLAAQQFGHALASAVGSDDEGDADALIERDHWLADLAEWAWPAPEVGWAVDAIMEVEAASSMPAPPPHAVFERTRERSTLQALAAALGPDEFQRVLPAFFNISSYLGFAAGVERDSEWVGVAWSNLRDEEPVSPSEVMQLQARL
jgi:hypothetical protein